MTAEKFKPDMLVKVKPGFCSKNSGKVLNTSTKAKGDEVNFPGWTGYPTVLDACITNPQYFEIVETPVINNYEIY